MCHPEKDSVVSKVREPEYIFIPNLTEKDVKIIMRSLLNAQGISRSLTWAEMQHAEKLHRRLTRQFKEKV